MRHLCLSLFLIFFALPVISQDFFGFSHDFKRIDLPFDYHNNLIIVDVTLNKLFPLKFIFDTGAENTILAKKEITDLLRVPYEREFKLLGSDMKTELTAYLVRNIHFKMHDLVIPAHSMLVLDEDYFRFEEVAGLEIHGILGADVFRSLVVKINYERKVITLTKRQYFDPPKDYDVIPIQIFRGKPYLSTDLKIQKDTTISVKLLIDSGAMMGVVLHTNTDSALHLPPNVLTGKLGAGLGGYLEGYLGRLHALQVGKVSFNEILTNFQDISQAIDTTQLNGRNGLLGNQVLNRFHVIIDYLQGVMYLKPNRKFKKAFEFDKSGLVIIAANVRLNNFIVHDVIPGSPAAEAGISIGDRITKLNGLPVQFLSLDSIAKKLRKKEGKKIKLRVRRGKEKLNIQFKLKKLI